MFNWNRKFHLCSSLANTCNNIYTKTRIQPIKHLEVQLQIDNYRVVLLMTPKVWWQYGLDLSLDSPEFICFDFFSPHQIPQVSSVVIVIRKKKKEKMEKNAKKTSYTTLKKISVCLPTRLGPHPSLRLPHDYDSQNKDILLGWKMRRQQLKLFEGPAPRLADILGVQWQPKKNHVRGGFALSGWWELLIHLQIWYT